MDQSAVSFDYEILNKQVLDNAVISDEGLSITGVEQKVNELISEYN
jgi:hypothetical protein